MFRRAFSLFFIFCFLCGLCALSPVRSYAEGYEPLPDLLIFQQQNVQKDLGAQRKECRTYPKTANEQVNEQVRQAVDQLADETFNHLPKHGGEVMTWADTGASVTVTGTKLASFLILSHVIHEREQTYVSFRTMTFDLEGGREITLNNLLAPEAGELIRAAIRDQLRAYFPGSRADERALKQLADGYETAPFTLTPAYLMFHFRADALYSGHNTLMHVWIPYSWLTDWMTGFAREQTDNSRYLLAAPTFDDGPSRGVTANVLFILRKYCAGATFFNNGPQMAKCHDYVQWEHDAGYAVQSHTWSHTVGLRDKNQIFTEKQTLEDLQVSLIGLKPYYMRSPGGVDNEYVRVKIGMPIIRWNASTYDAVSDYSLSRSRGVLTSTLTDTAVILSHNLAQHSGHNCEQLLSILQQRGYLTVTSDELFRIRNVEIKNDTVYTGDETGAAGWERAEAEAMLQREGVLPAPTQATTPEPSGTPAPTEAPKSTEAPASEPTWTPAPTEPPAPEMTLIPVGLPIPDLTETPWSGELRVSTPRPDRE